MTTPSDKSDSLNRKRQRCLEMIHYAINRGGLELDTHETAELYELFKDFAATPLPELQHSEYAPLATTTMFVSGNTSEEDCAAAHAELDAAGIGAQGSFDGGKTWQEYSLAHRIHIVCGANVMMQRESEERDEEAATLSTTGALDAERYRARRSEEYLQLCHQLNAGETTDREQHARSYDAHSDWLIRGKTSVVSAIQPIAKRICLDESIADGGTGVRCDSQCSACQDEDVLKHGSNAALLPPY